MLGEKINGLETNDESLEEKIEGGDVQNMQGSQNLVAPGTPKRTSTEEPRPKRIVKRRGDQKVLKHPEVGKEILLETYGGRRKYVVISKKSKKMEDYNYTLTNEEGEQVNFDLKDQSWEYSQEEDDPLKSWEN